ncbi:Riboflavin transport system permease protein RibX [bacterium HR39]|nr:Riboflavin transport system permease protein RibX [bacterium HR39]
MSGRAADRLLRTAVLAALLLLWEGLVRLYEVPHWLVPGPLAVAAELWRAREVLLPALAVTLGTALLALVVAVGAAVTLGVLAVLSRLLEYAILPVAVTLQVVPVVAVAPVILVYVERVETALVLCAALVAFFPVLANTITGLERIDPEQRDLFRLYGASRWQELLWLRLPAALPYILAGIRVAGTLALVGAVVAEFAAGTAGEQAGLAFRILESGWRLRIARMYAALVLLAAAGLLLHGLLRQGERLMLRRLHLAAREEARPSSST